MRSFMNRLLSRKFLMAVGAGIVAFLKVLYPDIPEDAIKYVVAVSLGYATIEGIVDAAYALVRWWLERKQEECQSCLDDEVVARRRS